MLLNVDDDSVESRKDLRAVALALYERPKSRAQTPALKTLSRIKSHHEVAKYQMQSKSEKMQDKIEALFEQRRKKMLSQRLHSLPLLSATRFAMAGEEHLLRQELRRGHDPNLRDPCNGRNVLHEACANGHYPIVRMLLLEHAVEVNLPTILGESTALHLAVEKGFRQIVSILLGHGANVHALDAEGCIPLHSATKFNIVKVLFKSCPTLDPTIRNSKGCTPLEHYLACTPPKSQDHDLVDFLRSKEDQRMIEMTRERLQHIRADKNQKLRLEAMIISANTTTVASSPMKVVLKKS